MRWYLALFGDAPAWMSLAPLSVIATVAMLWIFGRTSRPGRIRGARQQVLARLLEMRLYGDDPVIVLRAQGALLAANFRYLGWLLVPVLCSAIVLGPVFLAMENVYGYRPLAAGEAALLTVGLSAPAEVQVAVPAGLRLESAGVRLEEGREVVWRIRAEAAGSGDIQVRVRDEVQAYRAEVAGGARALVHRRDGSWRDVLENPGEPRLLGREVQWMTLAYPEAEVALFGWRMHWMWAFLMISLPVFGLLRSRFGVVL